MLNKIKEMIDKRGMFKRGQSLLLAVSGGPDSVAMLFALHGLSNKLNLDLYIAHINHKLRGAESDKDQNYVERLSRKLNIPLFVLKKDTKSFAKKNKLSIEDAARQIRYSFFTECARRFKIDSISTAHTLDDQAETILMRFLRGAGIRGLRGIQPVSDLFEFKLIRPLIEITRKEIEAYLREKEIRPRIDKSNLDIKFLRNRIRHKLVPQLVKEYNPNLKNQLLMLAKMLNEDYNYIQFLSDELFNKIATSSNSKKVVFKLRAFKALNVSAQRYLVRSAIKRLALTLDNIEYRHWKEIKSLLSSRPIGSIVNLPNYIVATKTKSSLIFIIKNKATKTKLKVKELVLNVPGITTYNRNKIKTVLKDKPPKVYSKNNRIEFFDLEKMNLPIIVRKRKKGDKIKPLGMKGYKKLSDLFIDKKIPKQRRDNVPVIVSASGDIIWVAGLCASDNQKLVSDSSKILKLELLTG